jgi:hypothetical protein
VTREFSPLKLHKEHLPHLGDNILKPSKFFGLGRGGKGSGLGREGFKTSSKNKNKNVIDVLNIVPLSRGPNYP